MTEDDIHDSLTRQAELRRRIKERNQVELAKILEAEDVNGLNVLGSEQSSSPPYSEELQSWTASLRVNDPGWLVGGLALQQDIQSCQIIITRLAVQNSDIQSVFANQAQLGIIVFAASIGALWMFHKRRRSIDSRLLPS